MDIQTITKKKTDYAMEITRTRGQATVIKTQYRRVNTEQYKQNKIGVERRCYEGKAVPSPYVTLVLAVLLT